MLVAARVRTPEAQRAVTPAGHVFADPRDAGNRIDHIPVVARGSIVWIVREGVLQDSFANTVSKAIGIDGAVQNKCRKLVPSDLPIAITVNLLKHVEENRPGCICVDCVLPRRQNCPKCPYKSYKIKLPGTSAAQKTIVYMFQVFMIKINKIMASF